VDILGDTESFGLPAFNFLLFTVAADFFDALVAHGNWFPLLICYGGGIVSFVLIGLGMIIAGES